MNLLQRALGCATIKITIGNSFLVVDAVAALVSGLASGGFFIYLFCNIGGYYDAHFAFL